VLSHHLMNGAHLTQLEMKVVCLAGMSVLVVAGSA